jgi:hypothetical protein
MRKQDRTRSGTTLATYEQLLQMNSGYEQVLRSLDLLCTNPAFNGGQLRLFRDMAREARACSNAYVTEVLLQAELHEAARCFKQRTRRERRQEQSS